MDVGLGGQIVDLGWLGFLNDADQIGGVRQVAVLRMEPGVGLMRIDIKMIDATSVERR
jgi:hypothetical protein